MIPFGKVVSYDVYTFCVCSIAYTLVCHSVTVLGQYPLSGLRRPEGGT